MSCTVLKYYRKKHGLTVQCSQRRVISVKMGNISLVRWWAGDLAYHSGRRVMLCSMHTQFREKGRGVNLALVHLQVTATRVPHLSCVQLINDMYSIKMRYGYLWGRDKVNLSRLYLPRLVQTGRACLRCVVRAGHSHEHPLSIYDHH